MVTFVDDGTQTQKQILTSSSLIRWDEGIIMILIQRIISFIAWDEAIAPPVYY
jgi:hypothetical protein